MRRTVSLVCLVALLVLSFALSVGAEPLPAPFPSGSPEATLAPVYEELGIGDSGDAVKTLQDRLLELGYEIGSADGIYGQKTETAIKQVQIQTGLEVTGIADNETQQVLWTYDAPTAQPQPTKIKATPTPEPEEDYGLDSGEEDYIANRNTKKFHYPWCSSVDQMKESNKWYFTGLRDTLINKGYKPCKRCDP